MVEKWYYCGICLFSNPVITPKVAFVLLPNDSVNYGSWKNPSQMLWSWMKWAFKNQHQVCIVFICCFGLTIMGLIYSYGLTGSLIVIYLLPYHDICETLSHKACFQIIIWIGTTKYILEIGEILSKIGHPCHKHASVKPSRFIDKKPKF